MLATKGALAKVCMKATAGTPVTTGKQYNSKVASSSRDACYSKNTRTNMDGDCRGARNSREASKNIDPSNSRTLATAGTPVTARTPATAGTPAMARMSLEGWKSNSRKYALNTC